MPETRAATIGTAMVPPLVFKVHRCDPELIIPAKLTPHDLKPLSDIDDQDGLRVQIPLIIFYPYHLSMQRQDPVQLLKQALAEVLVFYYPFAGRVREWPDRKLVVECTGQGILFTEAYADVSLDQFGDMLRPPFPCFEELLFDVPGSSGILNSPLLLIQVLYSELFYSFIRTKIVCFMNFQFNSQIDLWVLWFSIKSCYLEKLLIGFNSSSIIEIKGII